MFLECACNDPVQERALTIVIENVLAMVSAQRGVIETTWNMNAWCSRHAFQHAGNLRVDVSAVYLAIAELSRFSPPGTTASEVLANFTKNSAIAPNSEPQPMTIDSVCSDMPWANR